MLVQGPPMSIPTALLTSSTKGSLLGSISPVVPVLTKSILLPTSAKFVTTLMATSKDDNQASDPGMLRLSPRTVSLLSMSLGMAFHFGGYEFIRNSCLALFTSNEFGFSSPAAFPLANALISPFSIVLLWLYGQQLDAFGPRIALRNTTLASILVIFVAATSLAACQAWALPKVVSQCLIAFIFLFQSSYQYLIYTQQWSFVSSVMTPEEGSRWFASIGGFSSLLCSLTGSLVPYILPHTKLLGLMATTCVTLTVTLLCQERAYALAQHHGFDPSGKPSPPTAASVSSVKQSSSAAPSSSRFTQARVLFARVPTLNALFYEVIAFQSLNTILNIAFVSALKQTISNDLARSAYTGRFYSLINGVSAIIQFLVLPLVMNRTEPKWIWRLMPLIPVAVCMLQETKSTYSLPLLATAFFLAKTMDYSIRSVVYPMVYQVSGWRDTTSD